MLVYYTPTRGKKKGERWEKKRVKDEGGNLDGKFFRGKNPGGMIGVLKPAGENNLYKRGRKEVTLLHGPSVRAPRKSMGVEPPAGKEKWEMKAYLVALATELKYEGAKWAKGERSLFSETVKCGTMAGKNITNSCSRE